MIKVGLTGGIGSGKSTVARIFESFGIPVYYSDDRAKDLMNNDPVLKQKIITLFGEEAYLVNELNRAHISSIVFSDKNKLAGLNNAVHPVVAYDFEQWCAQQNTGFVVKEAAILIESGANKHLDRIVVVSASEEERVRRVMKRDGVGEQQVLARIKNQLSEQDRLKHADYIINNEGDEHLIPQVQQICNTLSE